VLLVDKRILAQLRAQYPHRASQFDRSEVIGHLRASPYLSQLTDLEVKWLSDIVIIRRGGPGDALYRLGEPGDEIVLLRQGRVRIERPNQAVAWASAGAVLGQRAAITGRRHLATVRCDSICHYYIIPAEPLKDIARQHHQDLEQFLLTPIDVPAILAKTSLFHRLQPHELAHLAGFTMQLHFNLPHRTIVRQDKPDNYYYVLVRGTAVATTTDPQTKQPFPQALPAGAAFGEASLLLGDPATATVETTSATDWLRIHRQDFALFMAAHPHIHERLFLSYDVQQRLQNAERIFTWQEEGEVILRKARRHWIIFVRNLSFVVPFLILLLVDLLIDIFASFLPWYVQIPILALVLFALIWVIVDYRNDYHIVTSRRIAHQEKVIFFSEKRLSAPLDKIQDLHIERPFLAQLLHYGHLRIETAADAGQIIFDYLPHAQDVMQLISDEMMRAKAGALTDNEETIRRQLQDRLHLGLEERLDRRALVEEVRREAPKRSLTSRLPFNRLLGLQKESGNELIWRKHWLGLIGTILPPLVLCGGSIVVLMLALTGLALGSVPGPLRFVLGLAAGLLLLIGTGWLWWKAVDWLNDLYIVSDQRIEHIEKKPFMFDEQRTIMSLERVQNVEFRKPNPLAFLLNYGDVLIQTAAAEGLVVFRFVPEPDRVQADIFHRIENYREAQAELRQKQRKSDFADWLEAYHLLIQEERERNLRH
jgi:CRP-like cAMP-binding protein/uncharacterized membrane protein YdbT with pleckstrin-like domain